MSNETLLFFDCETTGTDHNKHSLIEIGAIAYQNGKEIATFQGSCKPTKEVTIGALAVNKVKPNKLSYLPEPYELAESFTNFLLELPQAYNRSIIPCGHNVNFDINFVNSFLTENGVAGFEQYLSYRSIDTAAIGRFLIEAGLIPTERASLGNLTKILDLGYDADKHHTALYDAELSAKLYFKMIDIVQGKDSVKKVSTFGAN